MTSYVAPLVGTFYVPPEYRHFVAQAPPTAGDFAAGARTQTTHVAIRGFWEGAQPLIRTDRGVSVAAPEDDVLTGPAAPYDWAAMDDECCDVAIGPPEPKYEKILDR